VLETGGPRPPSRQRPPPESLFLENSPSPRSPVAVGPTGGDGGGGGGGGKGGGLDSPYGLVGGGGGGGSPTPGLSKVGQCRLTLSNPC